jgi:hypothetical protein
MSEAIRQIARGSMKSWYALVLVAPVFILTNAAHAGGPLTGLIFESNAVPAGATVGDMWSFNCPKGGHFTLTIDTATHTLDPEFRVFDKDGNTIADADDSTACTNSCANSCPQVVNVACADTGTHYIVVQNYGTGDATCPGGSYNMLLSVSDANGDPVLANKVKLGGGATIKNPAFADPNKERRKGPIVDDGQVPNI